MQKRASHRAGANTPLFRGTLQQRLRLASGLILFIFAATHFINHALPLFSIDASLTFQSWRTAVTRSSLGGLILAASLFIHIGLALFKLARRSTLKMPPWERAQIALGLFIPFLLFPHIVNTRVAHELFGVNDIYIYELARLWPGKAWNQIILLLAVWAHGVVGIHFWLRLTNTYRRFFLPLFASAIALPVAAIAGFAVGGREVARLNQNSSHFEALKEQSNWPDAAASGALAALGEAVWYGFAALLGVVVLIFLIRWGFRLRAQKVDVLFLPGLVQVSAPVGASLLEMSRMNGVPLASVCGGRARCSTCRVRIADGLEALEPPSRAEARTLAQVKADDDVRLACQLRPQSPLVVAPVFRPKGGHHAAVYTGGEDHGIERTVAIMFLDVRDFTELTQNHLPYDVVFLLNHFFTACGEAIRGSGGWIDKYMGDGLLAVFGTRVGAVAACQQAIAAAREIDHALERVNAELKDQIPATLRIGIGIHVGALVLGRIGHPDNATMTVVGTAVNAANRLEVLAKELGCQLVISEEAARLGGLDCDAFPTQMAEIRGLEEPLEVVVVERARQMSVPT